MNLERSLYRHAICGITPDDCWTWRGSTHPSGYGHLNAGGGLFISGHRASFLVHNGPIPEGMFVCHSCDNPPCCNPSHLWLGTNADNSADRTVKGRTRSKLTSEQVTDIRQLVLSGARRTDVARRFGVSTSCIQAAIAGQNWKRVGEPIRIPRDYSALPKGPKHPNAKLTQEQAEEIRNSTEPLRVFSERYGISTVALRRVRRGLSYVPSSAPTGGG